MLVESPCSRANVHYFWFVFAQSFTVQLVGTVGGARIGEDSVAIVQVLPNDNPYGIVSLASSTFVALEADNDTISMVPVTRR